jgi:hypothetical protein
MQSHVGAIIYDVRELPGRERVFFTLDATGARIKCADARGKLNAAADDFEVKESHYLTDFDDQLESLPAKIEVKLDTNGQLSIGHAISRSTEERGGNRKIFIITYRP